MAYYNITVKIGRNVQFAGTDKQSVGPEYAGNVIVHASDDSSWFAFEEAKDGAISCLEGMITDLTAAMPEDSPELKSSKMLQQRLENLKEESVLSLYREGQSGVSL
ncbi:MAG: hypothetical protein WC637_17470 [Victivallales bacterium]|jgi:hypothetical protein